MSRNERGRRPAGGRRWTGRPAAGGSRTDRPAASGRTRALLVAAVAVGLSVVAWLTLGPRLARRAPEGQGGTDAAAAMTPQTAYETAQRLSLAGRHEESVPYYRRALAGASAAQNPWLLHFNYGAALYNVGLEVRERLGVPVPVLRSSIERVAFMREALAELDLAERMAATASDRATVMRARGERFQVWGFPWEGFVLLRQAQWTDPGRKELERIAEGYMLVLKHPEQRWTAGADTAAR